MGQREDPPWPPSRRTSTSSATRRHSSTWAASTTMLRKPSPPSPADASAGDGWAPQKPDTPPPDSQGRRWPAAVATSSTRSRGRMRVAPLNTPPNRLPMPPSDTPHIPHFLPIPGVGGGGEQTGFSPAGVRSSTPQSCPAAGGPWIEPPSFLFKLGVIVSSDHSFSPPSLFF